MVKGSVFKKIEGSTAVCFTSDIWSSKYTGDSNLELHAIWMSNYTIEYCQVMIEHFLEYKLSISIKMHHFIIRLEKIKKVASKVLLLQGWSSLSE